MLLANPPAAFALRLAGRMQRRRKGAGRGRTAFAQRGALDSPLPPSVDPRSHGRRPDTSLSVEIDDDIVQNVDLEISSMIRGRFGVRLYCNLSFSARLEATKDDLFWITR
jgi:hypothetical protein